MIINSKNWSSHFCPHWFAALNHRRMISERKYENVDRSSPRGTLLHIVSCIGTWNIHTYEQTREDPSWNSSPGPKSVGDIHHVQSMLTVRCGKSLGDTCRGRIWIFRIFRSCTSKWVSCVWSLTIKSSWFLSSSNPYPIDPPLIKNCSWV